MQKVTIALYAPYIEDIEKYGYLIKDSMVLNQTTSSAHENHGYYFRLQFFRDFDHNIQCIEKLEHIAKSFEKFMMCIKLSIQDKINIILGLIKAKNQLTSNSLYQYQIPIAIIMMSLDHPDHKSKLEKLINMLNLDDSRMRVISAMIADGAMEKQDDVEYTFDLLLAGYQMLEVFNKDLKNYRRNQYSLNQIMLKLFMTNKMSDEMHKKFFSKGMISKFISDVICELYILDKKDLKAIQIIKIIIIDYIEKNPAELTLIDLEYIKSLIKHNENEDVKELKNKIEHHIRNIKKMIEYYGIYHKDNPEKSVFIDMIGAINANQNPEKKPCEDKKAIQKIIDSTSSYIGIFNRDQPLCQIDKIKDLTSKIATGCALSIDDLSDFSHQIEAIVGSYQIDINEKVDIINAVIDHLIILTTRSNINLSSILGFQMPACILAMERQCNIPRDKFHIKELIEELETYGHADTVSYFTDEKPIFGSNMIGIIQLYAKMMHFDRSTGMYLEGQSILEYLLKVGIDNIQKQNNYPIDANINMILYGLSLHLFAAHNISDEILLMISFIIDHSKNIVANGFLRSSLRYLFLIKQCIQEQCLCQRGLLITRFAQANELIDKIEQQIKELIERLKTTEETKLIPLAEHAVVDIAEPGAATSYLSINCIYPL